MRLYDRRLRLDRGHERSRYPLHGGAAERTEMTSTMRAPSAKFEGGKTMRHRHKVKTSITRGYTGGVAIPPHHQDPRAAGCICVIDTCPCGATRRTNQNQGHSETSGWIEASK